jgi:hypothetical protein
MENKIIETKTSIINYYAYPINIIIREVNETFQGMTLEIGNNNKIIIEDFRQLKLFMDTLNGAMYYLKQNYIIDGINDHESRG